MKVAGFMTSANQTITACPFDAIRKVMNLMLENKIGAVVIVRSDERNETVPCGIITKSDILEAYQYAHISIDHPCLEVMSRSNLATCTPDMSRDQAARILERNHSHHAIVVDHKQRFAGVLSSWDITVECAKDHRAWPWNRREDGKFHNLHDCHHEAENKDPDIPQSQDTKRPLQENQEKEQPPVFGLLAGDPLADPATSPTTNITRTMSERQVGLCEIGPTSRKAMSERLAGRPHQQHRHRHHKGRYAKVGRPGLDFSAGMHHDPHEHETVRSYMEDLGLMLSLE